MACTTYNCDPLSPQVLNDCGDILNGSADQVVVFSCGNLPTDITDGTEVNALITAGDAVLFKNVLVELPEGSPAEAASYIAGGQTRITTVERTVTWVDANVNESSHAAYDAMDYANGQTVGALLLRLYEEDVTLYITPNNAGIAFKGSLTGSDTEALRYVYTGGWKNKLNARVVATPAGVFS